MERISIRKNNETCYAFVLLVLPGTVKGADTVNYSFGGMYNPAGGINTPVKPSRDLVGAVNYPVHVVMDPFDEVQYPIHAVKDPVNAHDDPFVAVIHRVHAVIYSVDGVT